MKKLTIFSLFLYFLSGCTPDDIIPEEEGGTGSAPDLLEMIDLSDADGVLTGIISVSTQSTLVGDVKMQFGTAVAAFGDFNTGTFEDAGTVSCSVGGADYTLNRQSNNAYIFQPSMTDPSGIPFSASATGRPAWNIPGRSIDGLQSGYDFPEIPEITSSASIDKAVDYEFSTSGFEGADEVIFVISSNNEYIYKIIKNTDPEYAAGTVVFTSAELSTLDHSNAALIQVAPYTLDPKVISGKKYYIIHEVAVSKAATIE